MSGCSKGSPCLFATDFFFKILISCRIGVCNTEGNMRIHTWRGTTGVYHSQPYSLETGSLIELVPYSFVHVFIHLLFPTPLGYRCITHACLLHGCWDPHSRSHKCSYLLSQTHCPVKTTDMQKHK